MMRKFTNQELREAARQLEKMGRDGDTALVHVNPRELAVLKSMGGAGDRNPNTGLLEFDSESGGEGPGAEGGHGGGGDTGGPGTGSSDSSAEGGKAEGGGGSLTGGPGGTHGTQGVADLGIGGIGPGPGMTMNGPSLAGIVGNTLASFSGPLAGLNAASGFVDPSGKTAASRAAEAMGLSGAPMGSMSFGGAPGNVGGSGFTGASGSLGGGQGAPGGGSAGMPGMYGMLHPFDQQAPGLLNNPSPAFGVFNQQGGSPFASAGLLARRFG